ncbi:hydrolase 1, exosortase A system-associated [Pelomicrobium sp. G1]|uniref:hydrolase 1, exosortase A system-associated n=1 Tax=unclassified Pelomicrobium TaxID=2815318 RepID=UPI003F7669AF
MTVEELPFFFSCGGESLLGIIARPSRPAPVGVLVIVGGPQYRVGSHRQFLLLSRMLAAHGVPCMRFDYRGMGDSTGPAQGFEQALPDVGVAIDAFMDRLPGLEQVVLWGLCDAASVACLYAPSDARVAGLVLLNPWVRTEATAAATYLKHYYARRLWDRDFWMKLARGEWRPTESLGAFARLVGKALRPKEQDGEDGASSLATAPGPGSLPDRMAASLARFRGPVLFMLSGNDYTAKEFMDVARVSKRWTTALAACRVAWKQLPEADHTFSSAAHRDQVAAWTLEWVRAIRRVR